MFPWDNPGGGGNRRGYNGNPNSQQGRQWKNEQRRRQEAETRKIEQYAANERKSKLYDEMQKRQKNMRNGNGNVRNQGAAERSVVKKTCSGFSRVRRYAVKDRTDDQRRIGIANYGPGFIVSGAASVACSVTFSTARV